tara:strand:+ start:3989 stop:4156 length:168 start_codon:yes stop_codon:yes gene_type:complete
MVMMCLRKKCGTPPKTKKKQIQQKIKFQTQTKNISKNIISLRANTTTRTTKEKEK